MRTCFMVILALGATGGFWVGGRPRNLPIAILAIDRWSMPGLPAEDFAERLIYPDLS
jgi:hypothetical protein